MIFGKPEIPLAQGKEILNFIPQRPPFVMIDKLLVTDNVRTITSLQVRSDNILCQNNNFSESGVIENIAQTAAVQIGYHCYRQKIPVPVGFIASVKDLEIFDLPLVGTEIFTEIIVQNHVLNVTIISGKLFSFDKIFAQCEMKIFLMSNENKII